LHGHGYSIPQNENSGQWAVKDLANGKEELGKRKVKIWLREIFFLSEGFCYEGY
jgi:hypothetical protein